MNAKLYALYFVPFDWYAERGRTFTRDPKLAVLMPLAWWEAWIDKHMPLSDGIPTLGRDYTRAERGEVVRLVSESSILRGKPRKGRMPGSWQVVPGSFRGRGPSRDSDPEPPAPQPRSPRAP